MGALATVIVKLGFFAWWLIFIRTTWKTGVCGDFSAPSAVDLVFHRSSDNLGGPNVATARYPSSTSINEL